MSELYHTIIFTLSGDPARLFDRAFSGANGLIKDIGIKNLVFDTIIKWSCKR